MKNVAVIHDGQNNFLGFNCRSWVPGMDCDVFEGTRPNAIRVARGLPRLPGRCIFVSTDYGLVSQTDYEIGEHGNIVHEFQPNR